ncbi:MAG: hypothetical protein ACRCYQ_14055 [Nocardioides sp.]
MRGGQGPSEGTRRDRGQQLARYARRQAVPADLHHRRRIRSPGLEDPEPKALPSDHPIRVEIAEENIAHDLIAYYTNRLVKEFRFVGLHVLISTQVSNATTGLPPSLKGKIGHFALCGSTPSEVARKQAFPDEKAVPRVPDHIAAAGPVALGTGSAKIEGAGSFVFKSYYAPIREYAAALKALGVDRYTETQVTPTAAQIDEYMPSLDSESENDAPTRATTRGMSIPRPARS